jgi:PiT family inorganic phosphate transporter
VASINWAVLGKIILGWILAPAVAFVICFIGLFFLQNVFALKVI